MPRDTGFAGLATSLSLAVANYKPIPQLPTASNSTSGKGGNQLLPVGSGFRGTGSAGAQQAFQVQTSSESTAFDQSHPISQYGEPSVLYVPASSNSSANQLASKKTVGPGKCTVVQEKYTPTGGSGALPAPTFAAFDPVQANVYRYRQQQAVNLGSWFVQEGWMESNFMSCATGAKQAEFDILSGFGTSAAGIGNATAYMERHWDTWITENDFKKLAQIGINTVRIPIGYWSVGPYFTKNSTFEPYADVYANSWRYVARAINWAAKYDIGVLVDLHGAYGSQNGQAHAGLSDGKVGFYTKTNMDLTTKLLVWIAREISDVTNVVGIELLNEPQDKTSLWTWYSSTMDAMRNASTNANTVPLYFHDAFNLAKGAAFVAKRTDFIVQDYHSYFVYTNKDTSMSAKQHTSTITGSFASSMNKQSAIGRRNLIVGEWSCALAPSSLSKSKSPKKDQTNFCTSQEDVYRNAAGGWTFWSYQMENCNNNGGWCFQQAIKDYLPSSFDSWGLQSKTASYFKSFNATSNQFLPSLTNKITNLALPISLASVKKVETDTQPSAGEKAAAEAETDADSDATHVNVDGILSMVQGDLTDSEDGARIGMVDKTKEQKRGTGSLAARATEISRRAAANSQVAAQAGYNDGFKSARYFAGTGSLSRLGFATQYRADSYRARVAKGLLQKGNLDNYKTQYAAGVVAAEKLVAQTISSSS